MDKKRAMTILGLGPAALKADAKRAFRKLAKKYHPDRRGLGQAGVQPDSQMKAVNAAFNYLYPFLPEGPGPVDSGDGQRSKTIPDAGPGPVNRQKSVRQKKQPASTGSVLRQVLAGLGKRAMGGRLKKNRPARASLKPSMPSARSRPHMGPKRGNLSNFESIFKAQCPGLEKRRPVFENSKGSNRRSCGAGTYSEYSAHKSRLACARKKSAGIVIGRVEKIQPISRINPLGKI